MQHDDPREHAEQRGTRDGDSNSERDDKPRTDQRASHVSSTDAQYGTHSSAGAPRHANADPAQSGTEQRPAQPTRGGAQTGLTGGIGQLDAHSKAQSHPMQKPGGSNPSAQSASDWQAQRGDEGNLPDTASEQARADAASPGRVTQDQGGSMTIDRGEEGNLDQAHSTHGSEPERTTYPGQGPGEAHGQSKYNATANEQDRLSQDLGGESLRDAAERASGRPARRARI